MIKISQLVLKKDNSTVTIDVAFAVPVQRTSPPGEFVCEVSISPLNPVEIIGESPVDALYNGVLFVRSYLEEFASRR